MYNTDVSKISLSNDISAIVKDIVQLKIRLGSNPSEKDIWECKLLLKTFEAYKRIKEHPDILLDTISSVDCENNVQNNVQIPNSNKITSSDNISPNNSLNDSNNTTNNVTYLFNTNNQKNDNKSESDSDIEVDDLFTIQSTEELSDDHDVELMIKKSSYQLNRIFSNRDYLVIEKPNENETELIELDPNDFKSNDLEHNLNHSIHQSMFSDDNYICNSDNNYGDYSDNDTENIFQDFELEMYDKTNSPIDDQKRFVIMNSSDSDSDYYCQTDIKQYQLNYIQ